MRRSLKAFIFAALLFVSTQVVFADNISPENINQILSVNLTMPNCYGDNVCNADPGLLGSPAFGSANFSLIDEPWRFTTMTGYAASWRYVGDSYFAVFGYGGTFSMDGPLGLTFNGVVTSGFADYIPNSWEVRVNYFGQWSDGLYGDGIADLQIGGGGVESSADLQSQIVPEPGTIVLFASALLGVAFRRRQGVRQ
jgi:PEP-CTERM motif